MSCCGCCGTTTSPGRSNSARMLSSRRRRRRGPTTALRTSWLRWRMPWSWISTRPTALRSIGSSVTAGDDASRNSQSREDHGRRHHRKQRPKRRRRNAPCRLRAATRSQRQGRCRCATRSADPIYLGRANAALRRRAPASLPWGIRASCAAPRPRDCGSSLEVKPSGAPIR